MDFYRMLADVVLIIHFAYVTFVVMGMAAIVAGIALRWQWVRNFWFRAIHFLMIAVVVAESLCGILCPLTEWEDHLRKLAGEANESGSFIGRWIDKLLFVDAPPAVLVTCYCVFGAAVLLMLIFAPPRWPGRTEGAGGRAQGSEPDVQVPSDTDS
jgi:hypothetical protein